MTKPSRKVGAYVKWQPRADHRMNERYSQKEIDLLTSGGGEWSIWADHPQMSWVWLVRKQDGRAVFAAAALDDLGLVVR